MRYAANYSGDFSGNSLIETDKDKLIKDALGEFGETFFICECVEFYPHICVDDLLEQVAEQAYEHGGDHAESYESRMRSVDCKNLQTDISELFEGWLRHNGLYETDFFQVGKTWIVEFDDRSDSPKMRLLQND